MEIAERFCKYFTDIGPNLARSISSVNSFFRSHLGDNNHSFINLKPTTTNELESICGMFAYLYINDPPTTSELTDPLLFAYDTSPALLFSFKPKLLRTRT